MKMLKMLKKILNCISKAKKNVKNTIRDLIIFVTLTYDYNKEKNRPRQLSYYPEIKIV